MAARFAEVVGRGGFPPGLLETCSLQDVAEQAESCLLCARARTSLSSIRKFAPFFQRVRSFRERRVGHRKTLAGTRACTHSWLFPPLHRAFMSA